MSDAPGSLLHLDSSHAADSVTRTLTGLFADTWRRAHGAAGYRYRNLAADPVPLIGPGYISLGRRLEHDGLVAAADVAAQVQNPDEEREWALSLPLITEVLTAHTVLIGAPMYNFTVPTALKAWIDRVSFPGAFLEPESRTRLLNGTRVVLVVARGGCYHPGAPREGFDFQVPYLQAYFRNLGIAEADLHVIAADATLAPDMPYLARYRELAADSLAAARSALVSLAAESALLTASSR